MVRMKGGVSGDRIKNDPAFARTGEHGKNNKMGRTGKRFVHPYVRYQQWFRSTIRQQIAQKFFYKY